ncbi:hypothetical protein H2O64_05860 [Kordia sp. YSTF-M3]|uniref:Uncharacterized protein n=1 Tax=Kordia aestuariivivens TaxID=2759037 RepID=A0ABR7Q6M3_9FLAO|nr:hypothetical protein [Kordia aestuariivivens]MBC8754188.1 hypothetical protein [Kordia aestuariivivens]
MCEHCTPLTVNNFSSQEDFGDFKEILQAKCIDGTFVRVINAGETRSALFDENYQCTFCETDWVLFVDGRSEHGYFLPAEGITVRDNDQTYESNSRFEAFQPKRSKNCGCCLGMIFLLIALIIYGLYSLVAFLFDLLF